MSNSIPRESVVAENLFSSGATVISSLISKKVTCGLIETTRTETSLKLNDGWVILLVEIPAASVSFIIRFDSTAILAIVKIMMGGSEELGAIGDSMTSEIAAQIASTMAEQLATQNNWGALGIVATLCDNDKNISPPPLHTCTAVLEIEGDLHLPIAVDFDLPTAAKSGLVAQTLENSLEQEVDSDAGLKAIAPTTKKAAKSPQPASFSQMTPSVQKNMDASLELVHDVPMSVRALLGSSRVQLREVVSMQNGTVFELNRSSEEPIDLFVNNILIARGEVVVVDDRYAVKISELNPGSSSSR